MARLEVTGTVTRIFYENKAAEVTEHYVTKDGEQRSQRYTAWFGTPQNVNMGDVLVVVGDQTVKIKDWVDAEGNPKMDNSGKQGRSVDININNATYTADTPFNTSPLTAPPADADAPF